MGHAVPIVEFHNHKLRTTWRQYISLRCRHVTTDYDEPRLEWTFLA
jgi:hypothetical protein